VNSLIKERKAHHTPNSKKNKKKHPFFISKEDLSNSPIICALALHHRPVGSEPDGTYYAMVSNHLAIVVGGGL
jgi:hypothetical protein